MRNGLQQLRRRCGLDVPWLSRRLRERHLYPYAQAISAPCLCTPLTSIRWVGSRTTLKLDDLPQGLLKADTKLSAAPDVEPAYPTVVQQARDNIRKFENCVVFTRVGGFYELYFEQAEQYGPLLNLKVASKSTRAGPVAMAGFPFAQLDRFLKTLVQDHNKYVAISEEFPNSVPSKVKSGGLLFDRRVTRVVTPGTLLDEKFMDPCSNNFCLAVHVERKIQPALGVNLKGTTLDLQERARDRLRAAETQVGLAWVDLSTGEFFTQTSALVKLPSLLSRISAKELIVNDNLPPADKSILLDVLGPEQLLLTWRPELSQGTSVASWNHMLESPLPEYTRQALTVPEVRAASVLLEYIQDRLQGSDTKLQPLVRRTDSENMVIDRHTLRGLEVLETLRDSLQTGAKGSLLHAVRRTVTNSGARLLRDRLTRPSTSIAIINERLDLVEELLKHVDLRKELAALMSKTFDSLRLLQKFALGRGDPDDLVSLSHTISLTSLISDKLANNNEYGSNGFATDTALQRLSQRFSLDKPNELSMRIANAIDEDGLIATHEYEQAESSVVAGMAQEVLGSQGDLDDIQAMGQVIRAKHSPAAKDTSMEPDEFGEDAWIMRKTASEALTRLHEGLAQLRLRKVELCEQMKDVSGAKTLTLRWTPGLGHICHVRGIKDVKATQDAFPGSRSVSSSKTTRSFYESEWTALGRTIDQTKLQIRAEEQRVFGELRDEVIMNLLCLRRNAALLDELDVACSSANLAQEQNAVRPTFDEGTTLKIVGGRHPTVTLGLEERGRPFMANDCFLNSHSAGTPGTPSTGGERIHLITGPNMAGKSTFLRQNALLTIMAQVGLFLPAAYAHIGVVDAIFARIGSADNLFSDQSTFMTEMLETAHILSNATTRSLVIMDEVGRGTTPEDGVAVAYSALWHLKESNQCRALFATHFHALADMTADWDSSLLGRYCTDIKETEGNGFVYLHKVKPGVNRKSHALKVASMAGLPSKAIDMARAVLQQKIDVQ